MSFNDVSGINRLHAAPVPRDQIMVQWFAAITVTVTVTVTGYFF
jgi:hypothetical protein